MFSLMALSNTNVVSFLGKKKLNKFFGSTKKSIVTRERVLHNEILKKAGVIEYYKIVD